LAFEGFLVFRLAVRSEVLLAAEVERVVAGPAALHVGQDFSVYGEQFQGLKDMAMQGLPAPVDIVVVSITDFIRNQTSQGVETHEWELGFSKSFEYHCGYVG
jgi:hypothetical protein